MRIWKFYSNRVWQYCICNLPISIPYFTTGLVRNDIKQHSLWFMAGPEWRLTTVADCIMTCSKMTINYDRHSHQNWCPNDIKLLLNNSPIHVQKDIKIWLITRTIYVQKEIRIQSIISHINSPEQHLDINSVEDHWSHWKRRNGCVEWKIALRATLHEVSSEMTLNQGLDLGKVYKLNRINMFNVWKLNQ